MKDDVTSELFYAKDIITSFLSSDAFYMMNKKPDLELF